MKTRFLRVTNPILMLATAALLAFGCASPNVNPPLPKANTGYVDFFADTAPDLYWEVRQFDPSTKEFREAFSQLSPLKDGVLRLAFHPGHYQFRISFLNRVITEPALVEVDVGDGQVTPLRVELTEAGQAGVQTKDVSVGGTAFGRYGRRTKIGYSEETAYRVKAMPQPSQPYRSKQQMTYAPKRTQ